MKQVFLYLCSLILIELSLGKEYYKMRAVRISPPTIVTRKQWGAKHSANIQVMKCPVDHVFIHHTAGATCNSQVSCTKLMKQIQNFHINSKKWSDIGYSFVVGCDGRVYEGRGWSKVGAHTFNYNSKSIGIAFMGNFDKVPPSNAMLDAAKRLIIYGISKNLISKNYQIHGHRDAKCTLCPGTALYKIIQTWPRFKGGKLPGYKC